MKIQIRKLFLQNTQKQINQHIFYMHLLLINIFYPSRHTVTCLFIFLLIYKYMKYILIIELNLRNIWELHIFSNKIYKITNQEIVS